MSALLATVGLPELVAGILLLALNAYALTGGADFGGGVWDLLASGPRREAQRALVAEQIGPIWEANHVWLVLVVVILFTAFPTAFAALGIVLHVPLSLMLVGIVLRGSSFVFRSYGARDDATQRRWSRVFAGASVVTPVLLGIIVGAIASGAVGRAAASLPTGDPSGAAGPGFADTFVAPWLAPFPLVIGVLALAMFALLAATYLAVAARDDALREDFRARALGAALAVVVVAIIALVVAHRRAPEVGRGLTAGRALFPLGAGGAAVLTGYALTTRRWSLARAAAALEVSLILWGWGATQFPLLIPPAMTASAAAAPHATLTLLLYALAGGGVVLLPALAWLFRLFGRRVSA